MRKHILLFIAFFIITKVTHAQWWPWDTLGKPPGYSIIQLRYATGMTVDNNNNVWIGFTKIGLAKYDWNGWTMFDSTNSGLLKNKVLSVASNASGIWAGTDTGLFLYHQPAWTWLNVANASLLSDTIQHLYSSGGNDLYIFSEKGFSFFDGNIWQHFNTSNSGLVNDTVQCMLRDASGILWIGTRNGLSKYDGATWQNFISSNSSLPENNIKSLAEDGNHHLFLGLETRGVYFLSSNEFISVAAFTDGYFSLPRNVTRLFRLIDGSILCGSDDYNHNDFYFTTDPVQIKITDNYLKLADTLSPCTVDLLGRLLKFDRLFPGSQFMMCDSLEYFSSKATPTDYNYLDINQVKCGMFNDNIFHWDEVGEARYEVPKNNFTNSVFASALWIGGLDQNENLHMAAQTYRQSGNDFWPGPLDTISASIDSATAIQYDSIWKINRYTIDEFITQYNLGNVSNGSYQIPNIIQNWPAHGTGNYSSQLAPFVDHNADGIYNPMDGDYPKIKGDQMLWWVMNDNKDAHGETNGTPLGIEIHASAYAYYCLNIPDSNDVVNYTTFYSFDFINRSDTDYHDVYLGLYVDVDLGNYGDDFVGCNIQNDFGFAYNGDNNDEGIAGYGLNPPMMSVAVLKGPLAEPGDSLDNNHNGVTDETSENCSLNHFLYYNNDNDACAGNPGNAQDFYEYLTSFWRCGTHVTYGGNGRGGGVGGTNIPTDYFFSGMPYDTGWTEAGAGNSPSDRRMLMSSGPFSLPKGETRTADFAYIFTRDESAPNGLNTSVAKNIADVLRVKRWFDTDSFPCANSSIGINEPEHQTEFLIYPNPATESLYVNRYTVSGTATVQLYDVMGQKINSYSFPAGKKELKISTSKFSSGIYFVQLVNDDTFSTKKFIVRN
jgi:hypothetical protein